MGGRKGYPLSRVVGKAANVRVEKKALLEAIEDKNIKKVVASSAKILSKSKEALESLAHGFLFVGSIGKKGYERLNKEGLKARRLDISKRWAGYRKETGKSFSQSINRDIIDTTASIFGGSK